MSYWQLFAILLLARCADFLSTWLVTPDLGLEANPIVRKLGWKRSAALNLAMCLVLALDARLAIPVAISSLLIAARNCDLSAGRWRRACICFGSILMASIGVAIHLADSGDTREQIAAGFAIYAMSLLWFRKVWKRRKVEWKERKIFVKKR